MLGHSHPNIKSEKKKQQLIAELLELQAYQKFISLLSLLFSLIGPNRVQTCSSTRLQGSKTLESQDQERAQIQPEPKRDLGLAQRKPLSEAGTV